MRDKRLIFFFLLWHLNFYAQTTIKGLVVDKNNNSLFGANVVAKSTQNKKIISYAIVNFKGQYLLKIPKQMDSIRLAVSYLGYITQTKIVKNISQNINFSLVASQEKLREVKIEIPKIKIKGDTINYRVSAFKKDEDRAIIDVIKRLPGIEVRKNGIIYYNEKPINKFYIEDMDLLEGRYNLASNNLPANQVASVQVYENHQPIKILDSLQFSDRAALNIKLKKNFSYALPAEIATGYKPILWNAKFVPMLFAKKQQMLSVLQSNNTGKLLQNETSDLTNAQFSTENDASKWLQLSSINKPPFLQEKYIDNHSYLASLNYLIKLKTDNFLKFNFSYINDSNSEEAITNEVYYLPGNTIELSRTKHNVYEHKLIKTQLIFEKNTRKTYLKNIFKFNLKKFDEKGTMSSSNETERLKYPFYSFSNTLNWSFPLGKQIISWQAELSYIDTQQELEVLPGQFLDLLNNGNAYNKTIQFLNNNQFTANTGGGIIKKMGNFTLENYLRIRFEKSFLKSHINIYNPDVKPADNRFQNNTAYSVLDLINDIDVSYSTNSNYRINIHFPLAYKHILLSDYSIKRSKKLNKFIPEYNLSVFYKRNYWKYRLSAERDININDLFQNYYGYIMTSYNQISAYNTPFMQKNTNAYSFSAGYKNILDAISGGVSVGYNEVKSNLTYKYQYETNGLTTINAIENEAFSYEKYVKINLRKYFSKIKTNTKLVFGVKQRNSPSFINNVSRRIKNNSFDVMSRLDFPITKHFSFYFTYKWTLFNSKTSGSYSSRHFENQIFIYPFSKKNHRFKISTDMYRFTNQDVQKNNVFVDFSYHYKPPKKSFELWAKLNNITNVKEYVGFIQFDYISQKTIYRLRPFQVVVGASFSF